MSKKAAAAMNNMKWKKVSMDENLSNDLSAEGLMGFEELDDDSAYELLKQMGVEIAPFNTKETTKKKEKKDKIESAPVAEKREKKSKEEKPKKAKKAKLVAPEPTPAAEDDEEKEELVEEESDDEEVAPQSATPRVFTIGAPPEVLRTLPPLAEPWARLADELDMSECLVQAIRALEFRAPTRIQAECIPAAIANRCDVVGAAETGSGKTLAFAVPCVQNALRAFPSEQPPKIVGMVILPSRELAQQVASVFKKLTVFAPHLRTVTIVGGLSEEKQKRQLKQQPAFAIGTPGRMLALMNEVVQDDGKDGQLQRVSGLSDLSGLRCLVLDEADRLVEAGHFKELDDILASVYRQVQGGADRLQTFVFSATLALDQRQGKMAKAVPEAAAINAKEAKMRKKGQEVEKSADRVAELMRRVKLRQGRGLHVCSLEKGSALETLSLEAGLPAPSSSLERSNRVTLPASLSLELLQVLEKDRELHLATYLLHAASLAVAAGRPWRCLLFVNAITYARRLEPILKIFLGQTQFSSSNKQQQQKGRTTQTGIPSLLAVGQDVYLSSMHAQMQQKQRLQRLERFKNSQVSLLVCTDVAARGLDLPKVDAVVMLQPPRDGPTFVHRAGRTARANQPGTCVCMAIPSETPQWETVLKVVGRDLDTISPPMETASVPAASLSVIRSLYQQACEVDAVAHREAKTKREKHSMKAMADAADLMLSDDDENDKHDRSEGLAAARALETSRQLQRQVTGLLQGLSIPADRVFPVVRTLAERRASKK